MIDHASSMPQEDVEVVALDNHRRRKTRAGADSFAFKHRVKLCAVKRNHRPGVVGEEGLKRREFKPHDCRLEVQQRLAGERAAEPYHKHPIGQHFKRGRRAVSGDPCQLFAPCRESGYPGQPLRDTPAPDGTQKVEGLTL